MRTVGGTLAARICGVSKWGGPLSAYYELTTGVEAEHQEVMTRGSALEASVLWMYQERTGLKVRGMGKVTPDSMPFAHANMDGVAPLEHPMLRIVEAKTSNDPAAWGFDGSDRLPADYQVQSLWYLGVAKADGLQVDRVDVPVILGHESELQLLARLATATADAALSPGSLTPCGLLTLADIERTGLEFRILRVEWDAELFEMLLHRVKRFLWKHVKPGIPPEPTSADLSKRDRDAVKNGIQGEPGVSVDFEKMSGPGQAAVGQLLEATRQRKAWAEIEEQAKARVQVVMGRAEEIRGLPSGGRVLWKTIKGGTRRFELKEPKR